MRRFIAGAKCPSCQKEDSLFFENGRQDEITCVTCGYHASRKDAPEEGNTLPDKDEENQIKWH